MLCLYVFSIALILFTGTVEGDSLAQNILPEQTSPNSDEIFNQIARENASLKTMMEHLKIRLELQSHDLKLMKMESLINGTQALLEMQKSLNHELLNVLNRIDSKLDSMNNHIMGGKSTTEIQIQKFSNCAEALMKTHQNGIYNITLVNYRIPFPVYCDNSVFGGNWTLIQRRHDGLVDFYRNWSDYKNGFGDLDSEFFIGLDKLHALTIESPQELLIELEDFENEIRYAKYDAFAIGSEDKNYALNVLGSYSGNAGDSLTYHKNAKFSTKDRDNDNWSLVNCAMRVKGGWWFQSCQNSHLNGVYSKNSRVEREQGINWYHWKGNNYSLKSARMLIRPKSV